MFKTKLDSEPPKHNYYLSITSVSFHRRCSYFFNELLTDILTSSVENEMDLRYVQRFSSYLTENIALQRIQSVYAVEGHESCVLRKSHRIHEQMCGLRAPGGFCICSNH